jgi:hypothetical protein
LIQCPKCPRRENVSFDPPHIGLEGETHSALPCSIAECSRTGTRLVSSLREKHELKDTYSGRICEGHYRKDLRKFKHEAATKEIEVEEDTEKESDSALEQDPLDLKFMQFCDFVLQHESVLCEK